ncbi:low molecular weight protein tyrosine phosphatase family protein [Sphingomonas sp. PB4P5]|uniref:low molecular weight protein tyrosine phosphatase family protein n=1 Tax=Parasphingomonas puruogangriensis TaxID=3096155 RepID=UPI002FC7BF4A
MNILFVCSQNRLRSPTAEQVFADRANIIVSSAGTNHGADNPISDELIGWADRIFVMERAHRSKLQQRFRAAIKDKKIVCLNIPDDYDFMDPALVQLLEAKMAQYLPSVTA